jgi:hypothetical protein
MEDSDFPVRAHFFPDIIFERVSAICMHLQFTNEIGQKGESNSISHSSSSFLSEKLKGSDQSSVKPRIMYHPKKREPEGENHLI